MYQNFSNECEKLRKEKEIILQKEIQLPKDLICHLGTFVEGEDLLNFFLISKAFNENTSKNYHFWQRKLLKEFNFCYNDVYDLSIIQIHYYVLYQVKMFGVHKIPGIPGIVSYPRLKKHIEDNIKKFTLPCQYVFTRGAPRGQECNAVGKRYGKYIFCSNCIKKGPVQQIINNQ